MDTAAIGVEIATTIEFEAGSPFSQHFTARLKSSLVNRPSVTVYLLNEGTGHPWLPRVKLATGSTFFYPADPRGIT